MIFNLEKVTNNPRLKFLVMSVKSKLSNNMWRCPLTNNPTCIAYIESLIQTLRPKTIQKEWYFPTRADPSYKSTKNQLHLRYTALTASSWCFLVSAFTLAIISSTCWIRKSYDPTCYGSLNRFSHQQFSPFNLLLLYMFSILTTTVAFLLLLYC